MFSPFNHIPDHILIDILKHLDAKSLKEAALVCKRWSNVIDGSRMLMGKIVLKIDTSFYTRVRAMSDLSEILDLKRKFINVKVQYFNVVSTHYSGMQLNPISPERKEHLLQAVQHVGANITHFTFCQSKLNRHDLLTIFKSMPQLTTIVLEEVGMNGNDSVESEVESPILLTKLNKFIASHTSWSLLEIITAPNLTYLSFHGLNGCFCPVSFMKLIENAPVLQTLIIRSPYEARRFCGNAPNGSCTNYLVFYETMGSIRSTLLPRLDTLKIAPFTQISWEPFCKFISNRSNTLRKLSIEWGSSDRPAVAFANIFHVVFGNLNLLEDLDMHSMLSQAPVHESVLDSLKMNTSITNLRLWFHECNHAIFERILGMCKGLKSMQLMALNEHMAIILARESKLTQLTVNQIHCQNVIFPNLEILKVNDFQRSDWQNFLKINGTIRTLIGHTFALPISPFVDFIIDETNVKHLSLEADCPIPSDINHRLKENPKGLESVEWSYRERLSYKFNRVFLKLTNPKINLDKPESSRKRCKLQ